jgi:glutaredoxin-like protein NrdH
MSTSTWVADFGDADVIVFSKPACVQCNATMKTLEAKGKSYKKIDIMQDEAALNFIDSLGYRGVPVVLTRSGEHWVGFNPTKLATIKETAMVR